jgi:hypothetical protein
VAEEATKGTAGQYRCLASPPSRDSTPPKASRDGTMSPLEYEAQLSPVGGPVAVLPDDIADVSSPLYYLTGNGKKKRSLLTLLIIRSSGCSSP